jgi:Relaxase/Mobilisation nuclease domain/Large polyvalent protein-associated domain 7
MIAKAVARVADGSFAGLLAYVSDDKKVGDLAGWARTAEYILDAQGQGARVGAIRVTNCLQEEPALAIREIELTQAQNQRSRTDRTYHLIVSFPPGERPAPAQLADIEDRLCAVIGLAAHQRISAVHTDTDHFHVHVAINKVHPSGFQVVTPYFDHQRLQAACAELEVKHGLTVTNHAPTRDTARVPDRAGRMELHGGQESLLRWIRDEAGPALLAALERGQGWQDLHQAAAAYGLEVKPRGAGLVVGVVGEKRLHVKPSDLDRRLSFKALTDRWGGFEPAGAAAQAVVPERAYPRAPLRQAHPATAGLFQEYQRARERVVASRKAAEEQLRDATRRHRAELKVWGEERRAAIRTGLLVGEGKRAAYQALTQETAAALAQQRAADAARRREIATGHTLPSWQEWLQRQAHQGSVPAVEVLRSVEARQQQLGEAVFSAADAGQARHVVYQHLRPTVRRDGAVVYRVADGGRVVDEAQQIRVDTVSPAAAFLALTLAVDRFGDRPLVVQGTEQFCSQVAQLAAKEGVRVVFADPAMEAERKRGLGRGGEPGKGVQREGEDRDRDARAESQRDQTQKGHER